jgi:WD40 repeat protein
VSFPDSSAQSVTAKAKTILENGTETRHEAEKDFEQYPVFDAVKSRIHHFEHECVFDPDLCTLCLSPLGDRVAGSECFNFRTHILRIFDIITGKEISTTQHESSVSAACFSSDGQIIATGTVNGHVRIINVATGKVMMKTIAPAEMISSLCFLPNGKGLASGNAGLIMRIFDLSGKVMWEKSLVEMDNDSSGIEDLSAELITSLSFSFDGKRIVTGSTDKFARILEVDLKNEDSESECESVFANFKLFQRMEHQRTVRSVCFSTDGKSIATGSEDGFVRIFDVSSGNQILKTLNYGDVRSVCFSPDGKRVATGTYDGSVRIFDVFSGKEILKAIELQASVHVCFTPDGRSILSGNASSERIFASIFKVETEKSVLKTLSVPGDGQTKHEFLCVCFSPDGKAIATGSSDRLARIFEVDTGKVLQTTIPHGDLILSICFSPDGNRIATSCRDNFLRIFDSKMQGPPIVKKFVASSVNCVCFSPDGKNIATGSDDAYARIFKISYTDRSLNMSFEGHLEKKVSAICFSPDGKLFATGWCDGGSCAAIFDVASLSQSDVIVFYITSQIVTEQSRTTSLSFSPDGKYIAVSIDAVAQIFDIFSGKAIAVLKTVEHGGQIKSVCFSSDGRSIVTCSDDQFARVFVVNSKYSNAIDAKPCMIFHANIFAWSSNYCIAVSRGTTLHLLSDPHNFATDNWLPISPGLVLLWSCLPEELQKQCFCSDSQVVLSEFFASNGGGLVALAAKWHERDPYFPHALPTLKRLFKGKEPVINAGLIFRQLLPEKPHLPDSETVTALLRIISNHVNFSVQDDELTKVLAHAVCVPSIRSIMDQFWTEMVELVPSNSIVVCKVDQVSFSEATRMYVAASESTQEPVFQDHFLMHAQNEGSHLNFEHFLVPFANASAHRQANGRHSKNLLQALVETDNIDIFGTTLVRAVVLFKWQAFGRSLWLREFFIYCVGLALLVGLDILTWQFWALNVDDQNNVPPDIAIISALFCVINMRHLFREIKQFICSVPDNQATLLQRIKKSDYFWEFWNWLDILHIVLGNSAVIMVWAHTPKALPVLAITSFLRWWGTLFFLQVTIYNHNHFRT